MTSEQRRILIPIDLHSINQGCLETLVHIARQLDQGLLALLLEDLRLQQVADLPFTTEITLSGARERSLVRDHLSQRHSRVTGSTSRALNELAQRNRVALTFEETAGQRLHCALQRDGEMDIYFPPRRQWLQAEMPARIRQPFINRLGLLLSGGEQDQRILDSAGALLKSGEVGDVYLLKEREPSPDQLSSLYRPGHHLSIQAGFHCDGQAIANLLRRSPYDLLLLPRDSLKPLSDDVLDSALETSGGQVLVIS